jgi:hypothetical protein
LELEYLIQRIAMMDSRFDAYTAWKYEIVSCKKLEDINDELTLTNLKILATEKLREIQQIRKENKTMIWESTYYLKQRF